ncbi:MAG: hypothetical protein KGL92_05430 [Gammaproteobacteria bacterium]|nr:hypothetical protein [Gammaproteobacteria bacterium]
MIKRRHLLLSGIAGLAGLLALRFGLANDPDAIIVVLRKRLNYLKLDDTGLHAFARDLASKHEIASYRLRLIDALGPLYTKVDFSDNNRVGSAVRHGEEHIVTLFLLSSDFFTNGANVTRTVHYLGYYDPLHACANPFARQIAS